MALVQQGADFSIKPEDTKNNVNYADWPLLLKNWDQCMSLQQAVYGGSVAPSWRRAWPSVPTFCLQCASRD